MSYRLHETTPPSPTSRINIDQSDPWEAAANPYRSRSKDAIAWLAFLVPIAVVGAVIWWVQR